MLCRVDHGSVPAGEASLSIWGLIPGKGFSLRPLRSLIFPRFCSRSCIPGLCGTGLALGGGFFFFFFSFAFPRRSGELESPLAIQFQTTAITTTTTTTTTENWEESGSGEQSFLFFCFFFFLHHGEGRKKSGIFSRLARFSCVFSSFFLSPFCDNGNVAGFSYLHRLYSIRMGAVWFDSLTGAWGLGLGLLLLLLPVIKGPRVCVCF